MILLQKNNSLLHKYTTLITVSNVIDKRGTPKYCSFYTYTKKKQYCQQNKEYIFHRKQNSTHQRQLFTSWVMPMVNLPNRRCIVSESTTKDHNKVYHNKHSTFDNQQISKNLKSPLDRPRPIHGVKKKIKGVLGKVYVSSTKNNTIITLIDSKGNTKGWSCSGSLGFKNARKSTTYAAQGAAENIVKKAKILGYTHLRLLVKGLGRGRQSSLRALSKSGIKIVSIEDKTKIPYNGCRLSKKRRI